MGAEFKPILTTSNKISGEGAIDYAAGQILFTIDTKQIYIDDGLYNRIPWLLATKYVYDGYEYGTIVGDGINNIASGQGSMVIGGEYNVASGNNAITITGAFEQGEQNPIGNTASGNFAIAAGNKNIASGNYSFAAGYNTQATGNKSVALGNNTVADEENEVVIGYYNKQNQNYTLDNTDYTDQNDYLFMIGNGTSLAPSNIVEVTTNKIITKGNFIIGTTQGNGQNSAEMQTTITGNSSGTIGAAPTRQTITGDNSMVISSGGAYSDNTILQNNDAIITSQGTNTIGTTSSQLINNGSCNTIIGTYGSTIVGGSRNAIIGSRVSTISSYGSSGSTSCLVLGAETAEACGEYSIAIGKETKANGKCCLAIGDNAWASIQTGEEGSYAQYRYAIGHQVKSGHTDEFVIGKYNEIPENACLFVIGNGTSLASSNIIEVETDNVNIKSTMKVADTLTAHLNLDWTANDAYKVGDLVINNLHLYRCKIANSDATFDSSNWDQIT